MNFWKKKAKKRFGFFDLVDKLMLLSVIIPPGYIVLRFLKWYVDSSRYDEVLEET
ncbi:MAG: hypothetical protein LCH63_07780 [Candidatus Melainabacteria bacterium]|uniref:Uncharacterized protein n=1 Tax=Candidatus Obscuribacter phosphatis TaxID=1906157 RepID=A0A8J7PB12_9BACT|nr:hypothetical protein [Candidatus Obscuribacter phosphatis]MCA0313728.1 hypothetical protein [Candidatus Melainabacteria bacterium]OPZ85693.1 MAG: hypothetical protein BWY75_02358 [bacterium ADurb.Bin425]